MRRTHLNKLKHELAKQGLGEYLYHASPHNLDILSGDFSVTPGDDDMSVFLSPYRRCVDPFLIDRQRDIVDRIENQIGKKHIKINNMRYSSWGEKDPNNYYDKLTVYVDTPEEFTPFTGEASGWLYKVALNSIVNRMRRWKNSVGEFDEYIVPGDVEFDERQPASVKYSVQKQ